MKRLSTIIIACITALCLSCAALAEVRLGAFVGPSLSWIPKTITYDGGSGVKPHVHAYGGVMAELDFDGLMGQIAVGYAGLGHTSSISAGNYKIDYNLNISYLEIPVLVGYSFGTGSSIYIGPQFDIWLDSTTKLKDTEGNKRTEKWGKESFKPFIFNIALKYEYMFTDNFGAHIKFQFAPMKTFNDNDTQVKVDGVVLIDGKQEKGHNVAAQIGICYKFEL
ncbi:MAG: PorT family protein [Bacteroidales bacterium]|nr:PorT family protein [Bacteroidales bacterium]